MIDRSQLQQTLIFAYFHRKPSDESVDLMQKKLDMPMERVIVTVQNHVHTPAPPGL